MSFCRICEVIFIGCKPDTNLLDIKLNLACPFMYSSFYFFAKKKKNLTETAVPSSILEINIISHSNSAHLHNMECYLNLESLAWPSSRMYHLAEEKAETDLSYKISLCHSSIEYINSMTGSRQVQIFVFIFQHLFCLNFLTKGFTIHILAHFYTFNKLKTYSEYCNQLLAYVSLI